MSANLSIGFGDIPSSAPLLHNATGNVLVPAVPVTFNLTGSLDSIDSSDEFESIFTSEWSIALNVSTNPSDGSAYTGVSFSWPSADGPSTPPIPDSDSKIFWDTCAIAMPNLFSTYSGALFTEPLANGSCSKMLGSNCSWALSSQIADQYGDSDYSCTNSTIDEMSIPTECNAVLGFDNRTQTITTYVTPLKNSGDTLFWYHDQPAEVGNNGSLSQAMDRTWSIYLVETYTARSAWVQIPGCLSAENVTTTTSSAPVGETDTKSAGFAIKSGGRWLFAVVLFWLCLNM